MLKIPRAEFKLNTNYFVLRLWVHYRSCSYFIALVNSSSRLSFNKVIRQSMFHIGHLQRNINTRSHKQVAWSQ